MAEPYLRSGALASLGLQARARPAPESANVTLCERDPRGQILLRGDAGNRRFRAAVAEALGIEPPQAPNTAERQRGASLLWLGPDEWLAVLPDGREARALNALGDAFGKLHAAAVDVSHARGVIGLAGPRARDTLAKGWRLDLHPRSFAAGRCAQSALARVGALLHQIDDAPTYDLYVQRSFMAYAWAWLEDAAREYGGAIVVPDT